MRGTFSMRLDEGLRARLEERAVLEGRSLANLIERLLVLGLGQVVAEREEAWGTQSGQAQAGETGVRRVTVHSRSVTACSRERMHRSGAYCKECGVVPP